MKTLMSLKLSEYYDWEDRKNYSLFECPGIYAININQQDNLAGQTLNWDDIDYIGVSTVSLKQRTGRFDYAIHHGNRHSCGNRLFVERGPFNTWKNTFLYVAMMGVECNQNTIDSAFYRVRGTAVYLEYEAFAQCFDVTKKLPPYNNTKS